MILFFFLYELQWSSRALINLYNVLIAKHASSKHKGQISSLAPTWPVWQISCSTALFVEWYQGQLHVLWTVYQYPLSTLQLSELPFYLTRRTENPLGTYYHKINSHLNFLQASDWSQIFYGQSETEDSNVPETGYVRQEFSGTLLIPFTWLLFSFPISCPRFPGWRHLHELLKIPCFYSQ